MRRRRVLYALASLAVAALSATTVTAEIPQKADSSAIPNYRLVRPGLATAGQPSAEALKQLKSQGFKTVVNLRTESEGAKDEEATIREAGLTYVWVPISPATFSLDDVKAIGKVLDDPAAAPVLLHCSSANRVGAVWTVLETQKGKTLEAAQAEGETIGLSSPAMKEAVRRVLGVESAK